MRSLLVSGIYFPPAPGGISRMMGELCASLPGGRIAVLTGVQGDPDDPRLRELNVYRAPGAFPPDSARKTMQLAGRFALAMARERPALLQFATVDDAYVAWWSHKVLRMRHIFYAHGNEILVASRSQWNKPKAALRAAACVVANSRFTAGLLRDVGVESDRIRVVHPGCDAGQFKPMHLDEDERLRLSCGRRAEHYLLTVGGLVERKGHDMVIRALASLRKRHDVVYLIAGDGPNKANLQKLAADCGVAEHVVFLGLVPAADLPLLYSLARLFVMVSRERIEHCDVEGFGIVFLEAAACGVPAVAGRSGGVEDAVVDGATGVLVDPQNVDAISDAIAALLADPQRSRAMGEQARRRLVADFSWSRFGERISSIVQDVAAA